MSVLHAWCGCWMSLLLLGRGPVLRILRRCGEAGRASFIRFWCTSGQISPTWNGGTLVNSAPKAKRRDKMSAVSKSSRFMPNPPSHVSWVLVLGVFICDRSRMQWRSNEKSPSFDSRGSLRKFRRPLLPREDAAAVRIRSNGPYSRVCNALCR